MTPYRDFRDFCTLYRLEPWDGLRGDIRIARLCDMIQRMMGNQNSRVENYLPFYEKPQGEQQQEQIIARLNAVGRHLEHGKAPGRHT